METFKCPNCNTAITGGLLNSVTTLSTGKTEVINEYHTEKALGHCSKCGKDLFKKYKGVLEKEENTLSDRLRKMVSAIPIVSTHTPLNWDYKIIGIVTGQSTTGTGVISEFSSSITDIFGIQSGKYNSKIKQGENLCFAQLRKQTLDSGGNAIIATDIDYSELGGMKGMIMVCTTGTAIILENPEILGIEKSKVLKEISDLNDRLRHLLNIKSHI